MKISHMHIHTKATHQRGFTLVEMLVVAALIAIFAGLAVFNITAQLEREKSKAAVAEARSIATGMSFAYDDLGFYPKIGLLRFNLDNVFEFLKGTGFDSAEYHSYIVGNQDIRMRKKWRQNYMASSGPDKTVVMHYTSNGVAKALDWPADPWGNPYVGYFIKTIPAVDGQEPKQKFIEGSGDKANFTAAIVSYGRNRVPGLRDNALSSDIGDRFNWRLYRDNPIGPRHYTLLQGKDEFNTADETKLKAFTGVSAPFDPNYPKPFIRERNSDDRYYEF
ncbi:MAG: type II secretion system protein [Candidatus Sumerlaeaceae bacterium]